MSGNTESFDVLLRSARGRAGLSALVRALGLAPAWEPLDAGAYGGLTGVAVVRCVVLGRAGTLVALLLECEAGTDLDRVVRRVVSHNPAIPHLCVLVGTDGMLGLAAAEAGRVHRLEVDRRRPRRTDLECLEEMAARPGEEGLLLHRRMVRALERSRVTRQFFRDFSVHRARVAAGWVGIDARRGEEREQLALLFLCRLMFLYFLQRTGCLAGDAGYMAWLVAERPSTGSFYRTRLRPLFFGALNTRPESRDAAARSLGALPYLNGGLFERHALERRFPRLDLADEVALGVFTDLLERYRFTTREVGDADAGGGVDPEMLGRVFEGLMDRGRRGRTGSFYTPARVVSGLVREALATYIAGTCDMDRDAADALIGDGGPDRPAAVRHRLVKRLRGIRVLDPACGSGAFLLDALSRLDRLLRTAGDDRGPAEVRREIVAGSLHGVDLLDDAALLCALRLWLALTLGLEPGGQVPPLPNLDRRIRQGDALTDPLDLGVGNASAGAVPDPQVRRTLRALSATGAEYVSAGPERRRALQRRLRSAERELARSWLAVLGRRLEHALAEARARGGAVDLFGETPADAERARSEARRLGGRLEELEATRRALDDDDAFPFFSFGVHFPDAAGGFDLVLSNPPWVRSRRWPAALRESATQRYEVVRRSGWPRGAALAGAIPAGGQVDMALLFLEKAVRMLAGGGVLAMVLPAKALRALYAGGARRMLLRELQVVSLEDHGLDQRSIFRADAFAATLVGRRPARRNGPGIARVTMVRRGVPPLRFALPQDALPVLPDDPASPWLLAPPDAREAFRAMQAAGSPLGEDPSLRIRRGVFTGANRVLLFEEVDAKLGGLALARPEGGGADDAVVLESDALRPCVRGTGIDAWRFDADRHLLWSHDDTRGGPVPLPRRAAAYVAAHGDRLRARSGWGPGMPPGAVFRVRPECFGAKVAWQDLSDTLKAVALPAVVRGASGPRPLVPLNTVYFIPTAGDDDALVLAALLNATPVTAFARAIAERAKDARFRFFAWTVGLVPLPPGLKDDAGLALLELSRAAHGQGAITTRQQHTLDTLVARLYGLDDDGLDAVLRFDGWLRGVSDGAGEG